MNPYAPVTRKFITAVWRRILIVRIAESIAISISVASAVGLALIPILWWQRQSAMPLAFALLPLGAAAGLIWGISRRPTRFQAALEADRQLNLHDLLGTIHLLANHPSDPWRESLATISDNQCRALHPSAVIVNRLGLRSWSGVGILTALLLSIGLLTTRPINTSAALVANENNQASPSNPKPLIALENQNQPITARPPGTGGTDDISNRAADQNQPNDSPTNSSTPSNPNESHSSAATDTSAGGGAAVTHPKQPPLEFPAITNTSANLSAHQGKSSDGPSDPRATATGAPEDSHATTATEIVNHKSPPWTSPNWQADANAAQSAINTGQVPDSDADLVRDYFRRD